VAADDPNAHHRDMTGSSALQITWPSTLPPLSMLAADPVADTDLTQIVAMYEACRQVLEFTGTPVIAQIQRTHLQHGWDGERPEVWVVRDDGVIVADLQIWTSTYENLDRAFLGLSVHPEHRGRGIGSALVEFGEARVRSMGRALTMAGTRESQVADERFADAHGYRKVMRGVLRRQVLADLDRTAVAAAVAEAMPRAADYEFVHVRDRIPDDLIDGMVAVESAINDAPRDEGTWDDEVPTVERLRAAEDGHRMRGLAIWTVIARRRSDGDVAGQTTVGVHPEAPEHGHQHLTAVRREHRGHRLGLLLKADMLDWLAAEAPEVATIDTDNAGSNDHMIGINELLGYHVVGAFWEREKKLD